MYLLKGLSMVGYRLLSTQWFFLLSTRFGIHACGLQKAAHFNIRVRLVQTSIECTAHPNEYSPSHHFLGRYTVLERPFI